MKNTKLQLGQRMRDKVSGFTGVADAHVLFMTGNEQFNLVPAVSKEGTVGESRSLDAHQLEFVEEVLPNLPAPENTGVVLGQKVRDVTSGVEGIATLKTTFINGCVYYTVTTKEVKGSPTSTLFIEYSRLVVVDDGVVKAIAARRAELSPEPSAARAPGGPSYKVPMRG